MVGDTETDHRTARAAGVPSILVAFGPEGEGIARLGPDALLRSYDALPATVGRLVAVPAPG
jgi:phosphoglycolate phosphatase